ncbi:MAG: hypothetical protein HUU38_30195, partial [Anaerolineales bacterium]|nr:hypothetical protein [Anaerolineales bacterium]
MKPNIDSFHKLPRAACPDRGQREETADGDRAHRPQPRLVGLAPGRGAGLFRAPGDPPGAR